MDIVFLVTEIESTITSPGMGTLALATWVKSFGSFSITPKLSPIKQKLSSGCWNQ